ncbi:ATP-binding cassette domain-containing protein [Streptococcus sciuri]|uniref:ATP-binding cassette domain-containing protein n=1 Tax=Streptococcus sciuri TaxID=2973939 RepID=A0ABT2F842_9STRE|nr:ATP-binding cassette domain-containing protein [Streptococcus sciuri]MCS4488643.1 ATP-binding cassette domain-containing protein [Streptococcus sciuri]
MGFIEVKDLKVHYPIRSGFFNRVTDYVYAVDGVDLHIETGKTYGLVGESGSGKSTIGKTIIGLEKATSGKIFYEGKDITNKQRRNKEHFGKNVQMIFQDSLSSFNPKKRILDIIAEPIRNFERLSAGEERQKVLTLLDTIGLGEETLYKYPHEFSGGQRQRIGVARALASNPRLIIADEPVSALDLSVQAQILNYMKHIQEKYNVSYLFISHDLGVVRHMCDELYIMYRGRFVETGKKSEIYNNPRHIYTKRLLSAVPTLNPANRDANKAKRRATEKEFREHQAQYFDASGRVFDLQNITSSHKVALNSKGGR